MARQQTLSFITPQQWEQLPDRTLFSFYYQDQSPFGPFLLSMTRTHVVSLCLVPNVKKLSEVNQEVINRFNPSFVAFNIPPATQTAEDIARGHIPPLMLVGSAFQHKVWKELLTVPFATTASYHDIAVRIGQPGATRAVGSAVGANPIAGLVPCHRIIKSDGSLGEYHWGAGVKEALLLKEGYKLAQ